MGVLSTLSDAGSGDPVGFSFSNDTGRVDCLTCMQLRRMSGCMAAAGEEHAGLYAVLRFSAKRPVLLPLHHVPIRTAFRAVDLVRFLALQRSSYLVAGVSSAFLSATRLVGVFVVFATVVQMFRQHRERGGSTFTFPRWVLGRPDLLVAIFISPVGLFAYILFLYVTVGDGLAFLHVQRAFGRVAGNQLLLLWDGLSAVPTTGWLPTAPQWSALAAITGLALSVVLAVRRQYGAGLFCAACIILPLMTNLASMVRYVVGLAPLIMLMAILLSASKLIWLAALVLFLGACYFMTVAWIGGYLALV